jgi:tetratricopeptide (TPR) repeat protein
MTQIDIPIRLEELAKNSRDLEILESAIACRKTTETLIKEERYMDSLERTVDGLKGLREFSDFGNIEFRAVLTALLFDLAEIHYAIKDYKQSEKDLDVIFRLLDYLINHDQERFGKYHILAMELSTRILRSRKKTIDLLAKQQIMAGMLYDKVNSGVATATDKLVDSLRKVAQLLAATGEYRSAMKFYAEAIKYSKKRTGRVTRKEVKMTIEMAELMVRVRQMRPRAKRLLNAILPHAIALGTIELEEDILALLEIIDVDNDNESRWKVFLHKLSASSKSVVRKVKSVASSKTEK